MWLLVKQSNGMMEEREYPTGLYFEIGDVLEDGAVVVDVPYPGEYEDDFEAMEPYED